MSDWCEIIDELHKRHREDERKAQELVRRIRAQLLAEHSTFLEDFTAAERRMFGVEDVP